MSTTFNTTDESINYEIPVAELIIGEQTRWYQGVCKVVAVTEDGPVPGDLSVRPDKLLVFGESSHCILTISTDTSMLAIESMIDTAISQEMEAL